MVRIAYAYRMRTLLAALGLATPPPPPARDVAAARIASFVSAPPAPPRRSAPNCAELPDEEIALFTDELEPDGWSGPQRRVVLGQQASAGPRERSDPRPTAPPPASSRRAAR